MKNYMVTALYDEGYGGFNWKTDIEKLDNKEIAEDICYRINAYVWRYMSCKEIEIVRQEKDKDWKEMKKLFHSRYPDIETIIWVSNDSIRVMEI